MQQELAAWIWKLCIQSGKNRDFYTEFTNRLIGYPDIMAELDYYRRTGDFLAQSEVGGRTVLDIMVWQIDHFKSQMDRGKYDMQENPACMVLMAFDTLLRMQAETGTDYVGKY